MLGTLLVLAIIAGYALHQYIKGGIIKGFISLVAAIVGIAAALGYYELAAGYIKDYGFIGPKAYPLAFIILFALAFVIIREVADNLLKPVISFGNIERAGGVAFGILTGYIVAGAVLITIGLTPYKTNWLYGRFEDSLSNPPQANKVLLNPDGFVSSLFGTISSGSLSGNNSFAVVHADYIDQIFLNRHSVSEGVSPIAGDGAVSIAEKGMRAAPENLVSAPSQKGLAGEPVPEEAGKKLTLLHVNISTGSLVPEESEAMPQLALSQLRLVVKDKQSAADPVSGSGEAVYPIGYLNAAGQLEAKPLNASLGTEELKADKLDFVFYVPTDSTPVLMEFRHNIIEAIRQTAPPQSQPAAEQPGEPQN